MKFEFETSISLLNSYLSASIIKAELGVGQSSEDWKDTIFTEWISMDRTGKNDIRCHCMFADFIPSPLSSSKNRCCFPPLNDGCPSQPTRGSEQKKHDNLSKKRAHWLHSLPRGRQFSFGYRTFWRKVWEMFGPFGHYTIPSLFRPLSLFVMETRKWRVVTLKGQWEHNLSYQETNSSQEIRDARCINLRKIKTSRCFVFFNETGNTFQMLF